MLFRIAAPGIYAATDQAATVATLLLRIYLFRPITASRGLAVTNALSSRISQPLTSSQTYHTSTYDMTSADTIESSASSQGSKRQKVNEFQDGRKVPVYEWKSSFSDWYKHLFSSDYLDSQVEARLLSILPFFPKSDGKRNAQIIDTDIGNGNYIHELFIENTEKPDAVSKDQVRDVVLVHGYAASLGLFVENFDLISAVKGIRIHAIDLLGFGLSSRPKFPSFTNNTKDDIYQIEDWFIDSIEEWRKRRGIERFVLIGHSFGGYLSCAYALKYNQNLVSAATGVSQRMIDKLILVSPVGVERHQGSLLANSPPLSAQVSTAEFNRENAMNPEVSISQELDADQEAIVHGNGSEDNKKFVMPQKAELNGTKLVKWLWNKNALPFAVIRRAGPARSKWISRWTTHRFSHIYYSNPEHFQNIHDYFYRVFNGYGSGEYAITRVLQFGALARLPLLDRCPEKFVKMGLPTLWIYGDKDWMNEEAGLEMTQEINLLSKKQGEGKLASFSILKNAGHHLYLDNPRDFANVVFKFLNFLN